MGLIFNRGCSKHHWEEEGETKRFRTTPYKRTRIDEFIVEKQVVKNCVHEGCSAEKKEWVSVSTQPHYKKTFSEDLEKLAQKRLREKHYAELARMTLREIEDGESIEKIKEFLERHKEAVE